jgi:hypothetical protein
MTVTILELRRRPCTAAKPGLSGYTRDGCRCYTCTVAHNDYQQRRARLIAYGQWNGLTDAEPVRRHLETLSAAGCGVDQVQAITSVGHGTISRLRWPAADRPRTRRVQARTAAAILAIPADAVQVADGAHIDATGTRRRAQALVAIGWPISEQARDLGREVRNHTHVLHGARVTAGTARLVAAQYERLSTRPAPDSRVSRRARNWAARQGWPSPMAWEGVDIDDPAASADIGGHDDEIVDVEAIRRVLAGKSRFKTLTLAEKTALFRDHVGGWTPGRIQTVLRMSATTVAKWRDRAGGVTQAVA